MLSSSTWTRVSRRSKTARESEWRAQKLSGSLAGTGRDQKSDASSDVFHLGDDERASTRVLQLLRRREFHVRPRRCLVGGLTNRTILTLSCHHPYKRTDSDQVEGSVG